MFLLANFHVNKTSSVTHDNLYPPFNSWICKVSPLKGRACIFSHNMNYYIDTKWGCGAQVNIRNSKWLEGLTI